MRRRRRSLSLADVAAGQEWNRRVTALGCVACSEVGDECDGDVQGHHVLYQQHIVRYVESEAYERDLSQVEVDVLLRRLVWDVRNGVGLCYRAHRRHHNRVQPVPLRLVPPQAILFAAELGLAHRIEDCYPAEPADRLTA